MVDKVMPELKSIRAFHRARYIIVHLIPQGDLILDSLASSINNSESRIAGIVQEDLDDEQSLVSDEVDLIEDLLGVSFVICQLGITSVVSNYPFLQKQWVNLKKQVHSEEPCTDCLGIPIIKDFSKDRISKKDLLQAGNPMLNASFSKIATIDSFANYFKHKDEWPSDWNDLKGNEERTKAIIKEAGAQPASSGNFRTGYEALINENDSFRKVDLLWKIVINWAEEIGNLCAEDLQKSGCFPSKP